MIYIQYLILAEGLFVYMLLDRLYAEHWIEQYMEQWRKSYDERMRGGEDEGN